jgi:DNA-binding NtrC family response regulator
MIGLYRPKVLLINGPDGKYLEKLLSNDEISLFSVKSLEEAKNQLDQVNIDVIVALLDKKNSNLPIFIQKLAASIPVVVVEDGTSGTVPKEWREVSDIFLRKKTAKESLIKIFFDLLEQRKSLRKAA